ncbi:MAG: glycosyltransferase [Alphaproteobacteria bacterium]|nr:glycosyltransferase [Alphaproteobacteria bacterium]
MKTISIVSPCYNEEDNVEQCHAVVKKLFEEHLPNYRRQHIFVDNASTDTTVEKLKAIAADDPDVGVVVNARNFGVFRSAFNGLRHANGDAVLVLLPVDLQDPPELIPEFVKLWESGYDIVAGSRGDREESFLLRTCRWAFYRIVNTLSDFEISPDVGEFQLVDRKVHQAILQHDDHYPYIRGIIASVGFKKVIVPYKWKARKRGISKHNVYALIDQALNGIFSFTRAPLRLCTFAGIAISIFCILFAVYAMIAYFFTDVGAPRGTMTIIVALFFLSGIQMFFIGMLGEYVTSIHSQVRRGPLVVERETVNLDQVSESKTTEAAH